MSQKFNIMPTFDNRQFLAKLDSLPEELKFYFDSDLFNAHIAELNQKYAIESGYLTELITYVTIKDFDLRGLVEIIETDLNVEDTKAKKIAKDFIGIMILPINSYLESMNVTDAFAELGGHKKEYEDYIRNFRNSISDENIALADLVIKRHDELVDPIAEEQLALELLRSELVDILQDATPNALSQLNGGLINLLFNKEGFKDKAVKALLKNMEKITHRNFILDEKTRAPSVRNWLAYFIKLYGTGMFDNMILSKFITSSENALILDDQERELLHKLLIVFRNIKFFPASLQDIAPEKWEIIPVPEQESLNKARFAGRIEPSALEKDLTSIRQAQTTLKSKNLAEEVLTEDKDRRRRLKELEVMISNYPEGSLERHAVEEEIQKLKKISVD